MGKGGGGGILMEIIFLSHIFDHDWFKIYEVKAHGTGQIE